MDIKDGNSLIEIHCAVLSEDIKRARSKELHRKRNLLCFRLRLLQELVSERAESRNNTTLLSLTVDGSGATVNNRLLLRTDALAVNLLNQRHNEL